MKLFKSTSRILSLIIFCAVTFSTVTTFCMDSSQSSNTFSSNPFGSNHMPNEGANQVPAMVLLYQMIGKSLGEGVVDSFIARSDTFNNGLADSLAKGLAKGFGGASKQTVDNLFEAFKNNTEEGGNFDKGILNFLNRITEKFQKGGVGLNNVEKVVDDSTEVLGETFGRNFKKAVNGFEEQFEEGGDAKRGFEKPFKFLKKEVEGGAVKDAINAGKKAVEEGVQDAVNVAKKSIDQINRNLQKNMLIWGGVAGASVALCASGYYGNKVFWEWVNRSLKRPKLIIKSSYRNPFKRAYDFILRRSPEHTKREMVFEGELQSRLNNIVDVTKSITKRINEGRKNVKYRNTLLYGPPGTGKTMFAEQLAYQSDMQFAMMSGSSFSKFKKGEGIIAMDELFAWAKNSKGLMIFIDEADSFLAKRENMKADSEKYEILNNFLNYTGERSDKFMIVFAANHIDDFDSAMHRRIDDMVEMPLPKVGQRERVLKLYRDRIMMDEKQNGSSFVAATRRCLTDQKIKQMAQQTEGLSNGDLEGIINTIKTDSDITSSGLPTMKIIDTAVERAVVKLKTFKKMGEQKTQ